MDLGHDVVVVGGSAAGLSAALTLARVRRSVLVLDGGRPRNAPAGHVHGFLTRDGMPPAELVAAGRAEVTGYGGTVQDADVVSIRRLDGPAIGFEVDLDDGSSVRARRVLVATGIVDVLPEVPGLAERWGRDVLHCPYCHGWEVRDQAVGILATGPMSVHQALLFRQLTDDVTVFLHAAAELSDEHWEQLAARGIAVVVGEVVGIEVTDDRLAGVRLAGGTVFPVQALVVAPRMVARADLLVGLGVQTADLDMGGHVVGSYVPATDPTGRTEVPGVWVAGNVTDLSAQVVAAAAAGVRAAAGINADLVAEETTAAVAARQAPVDPFSPAMERRVHRAVVGQQRHGVSAFDRPGQVTSR